MDNTEELNKSIDSLIDDLFADETQGEDVEKSMIKDIKPQKETADEGEKPPKGQKDEDRGAGRPKQISDVPQKDTDGRRQDSYDDSISEDNKDGKTKEQDQVQPPKDMKKSETAPEGKVISEEEWAEFQALKKSKKDEEVEELRKAEEQKQTDLIKSAVVEATKPLQEENELLKKSLEEQGELIKSIANKPQVRKAVTSVAAVEKFEKSEAPAQHFSKEDVLDVAEELVKSGELTTEHVIELEQTGYIFEAEARGALERRMKRK